MAIGFTVDGTNPFNAIFLPLANKFANSLYNQGVHVFNAPSVLNEYNSRIIFGAHANPNFWLKNKNSKDIFVNFEPIFLENWQNDNTSYMSLMRNSRVLDYSKKSEIYTKYFNLFPIPPFYKSNGNIEKNTDVLFVGSINERRKLALTKLLNKGINLSIKFKIFGNDLLKLIEKSKLFLDINFHKHEAIFNIFRFCLCSNTGTVYTGESGITSDYPEVEKLLGLTITDDIQELSKIIIKLNNDNEYRQYALKIQRNIAETLEDKFQVFSRAFAEEFK